MMTGKDAVKSTKELKSELDVMGLLDTTYKEFNQIFKNLAFNL